MAWGLLLGNRIRWLLMATSLYTFSPIYTFAQTENDMVLIPSGKLIIRTEHVTTEIFIDKFFMDRFEVTQEFYEKIAGFNPSFFVDRKRPVEKVNWFEAVEYCLQIGKRLPNEWEWASRSGHTSNFFLGKGDPRFYGWFKKNSKKKTQPVGQKTQLLRFV